MGMTRRLGVAVVGLGVGEAHARTYAALDSCDLRWLYDTNPNRAATVAASLPSASVAASYDEILADPDVDLVSIASYDDAHCVQVVRALDAGKHVFVEKPLSRTLDELRLIRHTWKRSGLHLASNLILRAAPLYQWLKREIDAGRLGTLYAFDGDYLYGRLHKITGEWRRDVAEYSVMAGGGVHLIDLMLWLTGERPVRVTAVGNQLATRGTGFRYRDFAAATFELPSGLVGRVTANFGCVHRHQHVVRVFGTAATLIHDDMGPRLHESRDPSVQAASIGLAALAASKGDLIPQFVEAIINGRDTSSVTEHDLAVLCACAAADEAASTGRTVDVIYV